MTAFQLPPVLASNADQTDALRVVAELGELAESLCKRAGELGIDVPAVPTGTADALADEGALRLHCGAVMQRISEGESIRATEPASTSATPIRQGSITERALAAKREQVRQDALRQLHLADPTGPEIVCHNWSQVAVARLQGRNAIHRSQVRKPTLTDKCREAIQAKPAMLAAV